MVEHKSDNPGVYVWWVVWLKGSGVGQKPKVCCLEPPEIPRPRPRRAFGFPDLEDASWQCSLSRMTEKSQGGADGRWVSQTSRAVREVLKNRTWT